MRLYQPTVQNSLLMVTAVLIQQQEGATDCGLFSIAAAYHAAVGEGLEGITFKQDGMREHLMECLERKEPTLFPTTSAVTTRCPKSTCLCMFIYCVCRLLESYDSNMIECDKCGSWFHFKCMGLRKNALTDSWFCTHCRCLKLCTIVFIISCYFQYVVHVWIQNINFESQNLLFHTLY